MNKRIVFIDIARSIAIMMALFDHSLNDFKVWQDYSFSTFASIKIFTASATPTFLFLFGMMLEIVYLKRLKKHGFEVLVPQLLKRSLQCYIGYVVTVIAGVVGGLLTVKHAFGAVFFLGTSHYGNILKLYTFLILIASILLLIRIKKGPYFLFFLALGLWLFYPLLHMIPINNDNIAIFTSTFIGVGEKGGPSVLNSILIVVSGILSASFISYKDRFSFIRKSMGLFAFFALLLVIFSFFMPFKEIFENFVLNNFRKINHPGYYIIGILLALLNSFIYSFLFPIGTDIKKPVDNLLIFGRSSLMAFTTANVLLNLFYTFTTTSGIGIIGPVTFIVIVYLILFINEKYMKKIYLINGINQTLQFINYHFKKSLFDPISNKIVVALNKSK